MESLDKRDCTPDLIKIEASNIIDREAAKEIMTYAPNIDRSRCRRAKTE